MFAYYSVIICKVISYGYHTIIFIEHFKNVSFDWLKAEFTL